MANFKAELRQSFKTDCLYSALGLDPSDKSKYSAKDIRKAYYRTSLKVHPDRLANQSGSSVENGEATAKFQLIGRIYTILSDEDHRREYDETGALPSDDSTLDQDLVDRWRTMFKKVTEEDIVEFESKYQFSDEEKADVKAAYMAHEGDMEMILMSVMCAQVDRDEPRFTKMLQGWVESGELPKYEKFTMESAKSKAARKTKYKKEAKEAQELALELGISKKNGDSDGDNSLRSLILKRQDDRQKSSDAFLDNLAAKYSKKKKKNNK